MSMISYRGYHIEKSTDGVITTYMKMPTDGEWGSCTGQQKE
jgi:hypothetical protein